MENNIKFPSLRLFLTFFICCTSIILYGNYKASGSFMFNVICIAAVIAVSVILFIPSAVIKKKTDSDMITCIRNKAPNFSLIVSIFYCAYFIFAAEFFLLLYTDMFLKRINSEAGTFVIAAAILLAAAYGAYKGGNAITRCAVFVLVFSFIAFLLFFFGNISNIDFINDSFVSKGEKDDFFSNVSLLLSMTVIVSVFSVISGQIKGFKLRHIFYGAGLTVLIFSAAAFFICFALGISRNAQPYPFFTLAKTAHIGSVSGIESFCLSLSVLSVFLIVSLLIVGMNKVSDKCGSKYMTSAFTIIIFVLFICADKFNSIKEILMNPAILNSFTLITGAVVPLIYLLIGRVKNV